MTIAPLDATRPIVNNNGVMENAFNTFVLQVVADVAAGGGGGFDPSTIGAGSIPYGNGSTLVDDPANLVFLSANLGVGVNTSLSQRVTVDPDAKIQTNKPISGDGLIIQQTSGNIGSPALGQPVTEIRGRLLGTASTVFASRGGLFLLQNASDALSPNPALFFADPNGALTTAADFNYDTSARRMMLNNALLFSIGPFTATNTGFRTANPTEVVQIKGNCFLSQDNDLLLFGASKDASVYYDGTDLQIDPQKVGTGRLTIQADAKCDYLSITDGVTAPGTTSGEAHIYVDTADGNLKVKFGSGTTKTIATDP